MLNSIEQQLSEKDSQLIEANRLGTPLSIYRIKPYMTVLYRCALILLILSISILVFLFTISVTGWYKGAAGDYLTFAIPFGMANFGIPVSLFYYA